MKIQRVGAAARVAVIFLLSSIVSAQSGGTFLIEKSVIAGGGGSAAGGTFALDGTIGQSLAGTSSSGGVFSVDSGFWASAVAPATISGTVTYGNAIGSPAPPRFISNVLISGTGSPNVSTTTGPLGATAGQYALTGFGSSAYTVTPTKIGATNGAITSFDAGRIALHVSGPPNPQLNATQLIVADVSGNTTVSSFDAGMIAKFVVGPPFTPPGVGSTGTWRFTPLNRNYASVTTNVTGEDYVGLLMGEVSGNWVNTGARPADSRELITLGDGVRPPTGSGQPEIFVNLPKIEAQADREITIPVSVEGVANKGVIAYEFDLRYDPSLIRPIVNPVDLTGSVSRSLTPVVNASEQGILRIVMYGPTAIDNNGVLLNLRFSVVGQSGSSPLVFDRIMFNEGNPAATATVGQIVISE